MSRAARLSLIERRSLDLSVTRRCALVGVSRSSLYYRPVPVAPETLEPMRRIDEQSLKTPYYGSRRMAAWRRRQGDAVGRARVRRLMRLMGLEAIYRKPDTGRAAPAHTVYPYLLRGLAIEPVNHVWCADITYIPMARGFPYLVAIMDRASRAVLAWRPSNTLDADFRVDALEQALGRFGAPEIFNTDQGSQFTGQAFTGVLLAAGVAISMDGRGRFMDNIFVERLWRSPKYEEVYLHAYDSVAEARAGIAGWISFYNHERPHQALGYRTPGEIFGDRTQPVDMMDKPAGLPTSPQAQQQQLFDSTGRKGVIPFVAQPHATRVANGIEIGGCPT